MVSPTLGIVDGRQALSVIVRDAVKNIVFYALWAGLVWILASRIRWLAIVLFVAYAAVVLFDCVWKAFFGLGNVILLPFTLRGRGRDELQWQIANLCRIIEGAIVVTFGWQTYLRLFGYSS